MKMQKRLFVLSFLVTLALLVGSCAQPTEVVEEAPPEGAEEVAPSEPEEEEAPPAVEEVVELIYQRYNEGHDIEFEFIEEFNESHPGIHVTVDTVPATDAHQKLILTSEAGTPPDIYMTHFTTASATSGLAQDLNSFVEAEGEEWGNNYAESGWIFHDYAGKHYAMPWRVAPTAAFLNNKLLEKAGLDVPPDDWTWDDFLTYAIAMTNPSEDEYGYCLAGSADSTTTTLQYGSFLFEAGGKHIGDDGLSALDSAESIEALEFLNSLIHEHKVVPPGTASSTTNTCIDLLAADKVGMWTNASLWRGILRTIYPDIDITIVPLPRHKTTGTWMGGTGLAISPLSENQEEAWEFIKWHTSDEIMRRWSDALRFMPPNISLWEDPTFIADDPERQVVADIISTQNAYPLNGFPQGFDLDGILRTYLQAVYILDMTPEEAMAAAVAEWDPILMEYQQDEWWGAWE